MLDKEERGGCSKQPPRFQNLNQIRRLDNVDLSRQVRRHFEADFLFANGGLGPGLHDDVLPNGPTRRPDEENIATIGHKLKSQIRDDLIRPANQSRYVSRCRNQRSRPK